MTAADAYTALDEIIELRADSCRQNRIPLQKPLKKLESTSPLVLEVASRIVKRRKSVTLLQLQDLCYYCKVWSLIWFDTPLFREEFQAWADGPVNADLFHKLREYQTVRPEELQFPHAFSDSEERFINCILTAYGCESGDDLSAISHAARVPGT